VFEMAMIVLLDPEFQQHYIESYANLINRLGKTTEMIDLLKGQPAPEARRDVSPARKRWVNGEEE
jgi:hypothetical protein